MFATYDPLQSIPAATKIIATVTREGRVFAIRCDNEEGYSHGLEGETEQAFPLGTLIEPGQMVNTVALPT